MSFITGFRTKSRAAFEERKEQLREKVQEFHERQPTTQQPIRRRAFQPSGIVGNSLFIPKTPQKKRKKTQKTITIKLNGTTAKLKLQAKKKTKRHPRIDQTDITGGLRLF